MQGVETMLQLFSEKPHHKFNAALYFFRIFVIIIMFNIVMYIEINVKSNINMLDVAFLL